MQQMVAAYCKLAAGITPIYQPRRWLSATRTSPRCRATSSTHSPMQHRRDIRKRCPLRSSGLQIPVNPIDTNLITTLESSMLEYRFPDFGRVQNSNVRVAVPAQCQPTTPWSSATSHRMNCGYEKLTQNTASCPNVMAATITTCDPSAPPPPAVPPPPGGCTSAPYTTDDFAFASSGQDDFCYWVTTRPSPSSPPPSPSSPPPSPQRCNHGNCGSELQT